MPTHSQSAPPAPEAWHISFWLSGIFCFLPLCFHCPRQVGKPEPSADRRPLTQHAVSGRIKGNQISDPRKRPPSLCLPPTVGIVTPRANFSLNHRYALPLPSQECTSHSLLPEGSTSQAGRVRGTKFEKKCCKISGVVESIILFLFPDGVSYIRIFQNKN